MHDFASGVSLHVNDEAYRNALDGYSDGLVVNLGRDRNGRFTLHRATCDTVRYDLERKGQTSRAGKYVFRDSNELAKLADRLSVPVALLNHCSRCKPDLSK